MLVFGHHLQILDAIERSLEDKKIRSLLKLAHYLDICVLTYCCSYIRIDGSVSGELRAQNVDLFQKNPQVKVAVLSMTAAGTGITLNAASTVIYALSYDILFVPLHHHRSFLLSSIGHRPYYYKQKIGERVSCFTRYTAVRSIPSIRIYQAML